MNLTSIRLQFIAESLLELASDSLNPGLLKGKLGVSIYFFYLARTTGSPGHQKYAEKLLDEVFNEASSQSNSPDFENGLTGIGWGISHLVRNGFCEADIKEVLSDIDDKVFRYLTSIETLPSGLQKGCLGYLTYVSCRLQDLTFHENAHNYYIFKRLAIELVNRLSVMIESGSLMMKEPPIFYICWDLPVCLILLGKIWRLKIYCSKIERILDLIADPILSLFPRMQSNRLNFLLGLESILQNFYIPKWREHADLLKRNIDISYILNKEIGDKSIHCINGVSGIACIIKALSDIYKDSSIFPYNETEIENRIISSSFWELYGQEQWTGTDNIGLINGLAGIGIHLTFLINKRVKGDFVENIK